MDLDYQKSIFSDRKRNLYYFYLFCIRTRLRHKFESNIKLHIQFILLPLLQVPTILKS